MKNNLSGTNFIKQQWPFIPSRYGATVLGGEQEILLGLIKSIKLYASTSPLEDDAVFQFYEDIEQTLKRS